MSQIVVPDSRLDTKDVAEANTLTFTFGQMTIPINSAWRGDIRTAEKIELIGTDGRVLQSGSWGPCWENEYRSQIHCALVHELGSPFRVR